MKRLLYAVVGAGGLWLQAACAFAIPYEKAVLENGLKVIILPDHRSPVVVHSVWYNVGALDEQDGKTGLAHFLEHLMFKGTTAVPSGQFSKNVAKMGGNDNAFTSAHFTAYYQKISKDFLKDVMVMEADRMTGLTLDAKDVATEKEVVKEERRMRTESEPTTRFIENLRRAMYPTSPQGRPVIGWMNEVEGLSLEDALQWYQQYYAPNNATLIIGGDTTLQEVQPLLAPYASIKSRSVTQAKLEAEPLYEAPKRFEETDAALKVPVWLRLYRVPGMMTGVAGAEGNMESAVALSVAARILDANAGRFYEALVREKKLADTVSVSYNGSGRVEGLFSISVTPKKEVSFEEIEETVNALLADFAANPISAQELQRARVGMLADDVYARDDVFQSVYQMGLWVSSGGDAADYEKAAALIKKISTHTMMQVFKTQVQQSTQYITGILRTEPDQGNGA